MHEQKVYSVDFSPDGNVLASGGTDRSVRLWTAGAYPTIYGGPSWRALISASYRSDAEVGAVAFIDDTTIASGGNGGDIFLRKLDPAPRMGVLRMDSLVVLPRTGQLAYSDYNGFGLRPLADLEPQRLPPAERRTTASTALSVSPDEKTLLGACTANHICWHDLQTRALLGKYDFASGAEIGSTAFSADGKWAVVTVLDGTVTIFDAHTRLPVAALPQIKDGIFTAAFSPDSTLLAVGTYDKQIRLWNTTTWQQVRLLEGHEHGIRRVAFSPDGTLLASGSWDRDVRLWDVATGKSIATLHGHLDQVCGVAFSPDGTLLASAGWDGMVRLWSVATHAELARFVSDERRVWSLVFAPDGKSLFYAGLRAHRLEFKPLLNPEAALEHALKAGAYRLEGPNLVR